MSNKRQVVANTLADLDELARSLSSVLESGDVVCLDGELGSGKSQFVRFVTKNLGFSGDVTSPTFCFLNKYEINENFSIFHFDLYRLNDKSELSEIGFDDYGYCPQNGIAFVEWSCLFASEMPDSALHIRFVGSGESPRELTVFSDSERADAIIEKWDI